MPHFPSLFCILQFAFFILHFACTSGPTTAAPTAIPIVGEPLQADIAVINNGQITFLAGNRRIAMPLADLVRWGACPGQGRAGGLLLTNGSWLVLDVLAADAESVSGESEPFGSLTIPRSSLAGIALENAPSSLGEGLGVRAVPDRLLLDNGDELPGRFLGLADDVLKFETDVGPIDVKADRATAILFAQTDQPESTDSQNVLHAWAGFCDGSRLLVSQVSTENDTLHLTAAGNKLVASRESLVFLQPLSDRVIYLSDLTPDQYDQTPYLDLPWPYRNDRNVTGGFLQSDGQLYLKGVGVHSAARLVYKIPPIASGGGPGVRAKNSPRPLGEGPGVRADSFPTRFQASLAVDDSTSNNGSVQFRVVVDGRERYASPTIRGGYPPVPISVDVRGARKLELIVDYADRADVLDRADWLDARLVK